MPLPPDILEIFDRDVRMRNGILAQEYRREFADGVRRTVGPFASAAHNWIDHTEDGGTSVAEKIDSQVAYYDSIGHAFRWKIYSHDQPAVPPEALLARGFEPGETCTLMFLDVEGFELEYPPGVDFRLVEDPESVAEKLKPIGEKVWDDGTGELIDGLKAQMKSMGDHIRVYAAGTRDGTIGCGLIRYNEDKTFGGLFGGSTMPEERGKGVYRGIVSVRVEDCVQARCRFLYTEAGEMSRPILERLGFEPLASLIDYVYGETP